MRLAYAIVLAMALPVFGQEAEPALKGPTVSITRAKATLVEQDFNGRLQRLEIPPEEAALKLLALDEATLARTGAILAERAAILDKAVIENLELIVQIQSAGQSGDKPEALKHFQEFAKKLDGLKARGKLVDEVKAVLPSEKQEQYAALVKEYHEAAIRDTRESASRRGEKLTLNEAVRREMLQAIGREIKRSYDRQITGKAADYEKLLASLDLKPEQETRIRNMVTDHLQQTRANPTAEQKRDLFWKIHKELDRGQRRKLTAYYLGK